MYIYTNIHLWVYTKNKNILLPTVQRTRAMAIYIKPAVEEEMEKEMLKSVLQIQHL